MSYPLPSTRPLSCSCCGTAGPFRQPPCPKCGTVVTLDTSPGIAGAVVLPRPVRWVSVHSAPPRNEFKAPSANLPPGWRDPCVGDLFFDRDSLDLIEVARVDPETGMVEVIKPGPGWSVSNRWTYLDPWAWEPVT